MLRLRRNDPDRWAKEISSVTVKSTAYDGVFLVLHDPLTDPVRGKEIFGETALLPLPPIAEQDP